MNQSAEIVHLVNDAKRSRASMEKLIEDYTPFILAEISKAAGRFVDTTEDLYSVGLTGFQEAVLKFDDSRGAFISFARLMIRSRCIDWMRKDSKQRDREEAIDPKVLNEVSLRSYSDSEQILLRKEEIEKFKEALKVWDIDMMKLQKKTPKSDKLKKLYQSMAKSLATTPDHYKSIQEKKRLPIEALADQFSINKKKVERGRVYIIAMFIIYKGDYQMIKGYLR